MLFCHCSCAVVPNQLRYFSLLTTGMFNFYPPLPFLPFTVFCNHPMHHSAARVWCLSFLTDSCFDLYIISVCMFQLVHWCCLRVPSRLVPSLVILVSACLRRLRPIPPPSQTRATPCPQPGPGVYLGINRSSHLVEHSVRGVPHQLLRRTIRIIRTAIRRNGLREVRRVWLGR